VRASVLVFAVSSLAGICSAQSSLPGCEPRPEVRQALQEKLGGQDLEKLKYADRVARQHEVLDDLIAKYPRELEPYQRLIDFVRWDETDQFPGLEARFREEAKQHPDDPLALYLAGVVWLGTDTPESIRLLEEAKAKAPGFAWPNFELASIYSSGRRIDKRKSAEYLASFFSVCPGSADRSAQRLLSKVGDAALQTRVASALRARLDRETDSYHLKQYEILWGLEFRTHPPQEHTALREQLVRDLKRLEPLNPHPEVFWMEFLQKAYKQVGASEATITALDDRVLREFPFSQFIPNVLYERWEKTHKKPEDPKDPAWSAYNQAYKEAVKGWIRDYPEVPYFSRDAWFNAINDDDTISEKEGIAAVDHYLKAQTDYNSPASWYYLNAAGFLIQHKWQVKRALELLHKAQPILAKEQEHEAHNDNRSADEQEDAEKQAVYERQSFAGHMLRAARVAGRPGEAQALRASIEGPPPKARTRESDYWLNRARLAVLENRKADGLTYYQLALQTRVSPPAPWHGRLQDDLTDEARALWKDMGGSDVAWSIWIKPPASKPQELAEGRWEKPKKQMPSFELADLSGKTWKLKTLEGKSLLINVWATWCGPCRAELPELEKLYQAVKDRPDFQILTFNVDRDLGLVEPFMQEKGYKFPVLPAYSLVENLLEGVAIPQNWVVDPLGTWRWTQLGYGGVPNWLEDMIQRLEAVKKSEGGL
jgi:thiol-disulfide isomerase/thioredoxin